MQTNFLNLSQLKTKVTEGQPLYIENHTNPKKSRQTKIKRKFSYFFTVENSDGQESWIIPGATDLKNYIFEFYPQINQVKIYFKENKQSFLTLTF